MSAAMKPGAIDLRMRDQLRSSDLAAIERIVAGTGLFSAAEQLIAVEIAEEQLSRRADSTYRFLFAETSGEIAGYTCYGPAPATQSSFDLYWIAVAPEFQGMGVGRALIAYTEKSIRDTGGSRIFVETSSRDLYQPTHAFYQACGYELAATLPDYYSSGDDKLILCKLVPVVNL